jgi:hypothetical protein
VSAGDHKYLLERALRRCIDSIISNFYEYLLERSVIDKQKLSDVWNKSTHEDIKKKHLNTTQYLLFVRKYITKYASMISTLGFPSLFQT